MTSEATHDADFVARQQLAPVQGRAAGDIRQRLDEVLSHFGVGLDPGEYGNSEARAVGARLTGGERVSHPDGGIPGGLPEADYSVSRLVTVWADGWL